MEFPCSASLGAMGSLLRKLDGLLRITQPGPLKESIWRLLILSRIRGDLMSLSEVHDLSLASSNYLVGERFNAYKLAKIDELLHAEDSTPCLHQLRDCLGTIAIKLEKLSDSSEVNRHSHRASYWMKDARELSYEIEDFIDQFFFIHEHTSADAAMPSWMDKISGFVIRVEEVRERYDRFKLENVLSDPTNTKVNHHRLRGLFAQAQSEPFLPIGIEEPTNELLELVKWKEDDENDQQLRVICILGAEGVGKTTLAQRLWRHLEQEFDCRAFVQTAKRPDMRMILRSILSQVCQKQSPKPCEVPNLIQDLRKYLQDKRYFIIIDDIWAVSAWDVISCAFPEDNYHSIILTTTTDEDIAMACCGYEPENIFNMKPLNDYQSQKLFIDIAFDSEKGCPPEFCNVITDGIIKRCGGLPLSIICIATLIADQQQPGIAYQLEYMQNFLGRNLRTNATSEEILKQVLSLCYSCLPDCLKTCLLYLSAYPENYYIQKDDLVKQWIAEDFICRTERQDTAEVASSYFDELVRFGLIQEMDTNGKEKRLLYAVHPAVFDFITSKSIEDNFISTIDFSEPTVATDKVRRLCLHFGSATYATAPSSIDLSQVRSLIVMGVLRCMPSLVEFKLVRVAILHLQADDDGDASFPLTGICRLVLLRYLQVKCNVAVELPDQMGCLKHLETLEILARIAAVPSDFVHLPRLLHLQLGRERYHRHRCFALRYLSPLDNLSLDCSNRATHPILIFGFPPFICMIPRPPQWIAPFRNLRYLILSVREHWYDVAAGLGLKAARNIISSNTHQVTMYKVHNHAFSASATQRIAPFRNLSYLDADVRERRHVVDVISGESKAARNITRLNTHHHTMSGSKKIVIKVDIVGSKRKREVLAIISKFQGIKSFAIEAEKDTVVVVGTVDPVRIVQQLKKKGVAVSIVSVEDDKPKEKDHCKEMGGNKDKCDKECKAWLGGSCSCSRCKQSTAPGCYYVPSAGGGASSYDLLQVQRELA